METSSNQSEHFCANCSSPLDGQFCSQCGQEDRPFKQPFYRLLAQSISSLFDLDGRAWRTLGLLISRPGYLAREYVAGRRARYTPPLRMFLAISIGFFLLVSLLNPLYDLPQSQSATGTDEAVLDSNSSTEPEELDEEGAQDEVLEFIDELDFPLLGDQTADRLRARLHVEAEESFVIISEDPGALLIESMEYITFAMLLLMPVLALIQKTLFLFSKHYYVEHLIFTLYNQTFVFLIFILLVGIGLIAGAGSPLLRQLAELAENLVILWVLVYLYLALKNYFGQGYLLTFVKYAVASVLFTVAFIFAALSVITIAFIML